jgi:hypothetical protein
MSLQAHQYLIYLVQLLFLMENFGPRDGSPKSGAGRKESQNQFKLMFFIIALDFTFFTSVSSLPTCLPVRQASYII